MQQLLDKVLRPSSAFFKMHQTPVLSTVYAHAQKDTQTRVQQDRASRRCVALLEVLQSPSLKSLPTKLGSIANNASRWKDCTKCLRDAVVEQKKITATLDLEALANVNSWEQVNDQLAAYESVVIREQRRRFVTGLVAGFERIIEASDFAAFKPGGLPEVIQNLKAHAVFLKGCSLENLVVHESRELVENTALAEQESLVSTVTEGLKVISKLIEGGDGAAGEAVINPISKFAVELTNLELDGKAFVPCDGSVEEWKASEARAAIDKFVSIMRDALLRKFTKELSAMHSSLFSRYAATTVGVLLEKLAAAKQEGDPRASFDKIILDAVKSGALYIAHETHILGHAQSFKPHSPHIAWVTAASAIVRGSPAEIFTLQSGVDEAAHSADLPLMALLWLHGFEQLFCSAVQVKAALRLNARKAETANFQALMVAKSYLKSMQSHIATSQKIIGLVCPGNIAAELKDLVGNFLPTFASALGQGLYSSAQECHKELMDAAALVEKEDLIELIEKAVTVDDAIKKKALAIIGSKASQAFKKLFKAYTMSKSIIAQLAVGIKELVPSVEGPSKEVASFTRSKGYVKMKILYGCLAAAQSSFRELKKNEDRTTLLDQASSVIKMLCDEVVVEMPVNHTHQTRVAAGLAEDDVVFEMPPKFMLLLNPAPEDVSN